MEPSWTDIMSQDVLLDVSQSVDRTGLSKDGFVMTLTNACGSIFNPRTGSSLTAHQCLALQGFNPNELLFLDEFSDSELMSMAGMAMSVHVVGTIFWLVAARRCAP